MRQCDSGIDSVCQSARVTVCVRQCVNLCQLPKAQEYLGEDHDGVVWQVVEHTREGIVQLAKAEDSQKSARGLKCVAALVVGIIILLIIIYFKFKRAFGRY